MAPKAKSKNQRDRRLRNSAEHQHVDRFMQRKLGIAKESVDFKSNSISPGTPFMLELGEHISFFLKRKLHEDFEWRGLDVVFSGGNVPGEGEHKIMDFIRCKTPSLDLRDSHCVYSNDSDLVLLGLKLHLPNLFVLREEHVFVDADRRTNYAAKRFSSPVKMELLFVNVLREYLFLEFLEPALLKQFRAKFEGDWGPFGPDVSANRRRGNAQRFVDDFVLLTCLVGNDFLPPVFGLSTKNGHFDLFIRELKAFYATEGVFLVFREEILWPNLLRFLRQLSHLQNKLIKDCQGIFSREIKQYDRRKKMLRAGSAPRGEEGVLTGGDEDLETDLFLLRYKNDYLQLVRAREKLHKMLELQDDPGERSLFYYLNYLREGPELRDPARCEDVVERMCRNYFEGMQFKHGYYTLGCPSWVWLYEFELCPLLPDLVAFLERHLAQVKGEPPFPLVPGKPFRPFVQLLHILPRKSFDLLPAVFEETLFAETDEPSSPPPLEGDFGFDFSAFSFEGDGPQQPAAPPQGSLRRLRRSFAKEFPVVAVDNTRNYTWHPLLAPVLKEDVLKLISAVDWAALSEVDRRRNSFVQTQVFSFDADAAELVEPTLPGFEAATMQVRVADFDFERRFGKCARRLDRVYVGLQASLDLTRFASPSFLRRFGGFGQVKLKSSLRRKRQVMFLQVSAKVLRELLLDESVEAAVDAHLDSVELSRKAAAPAKLSLRAKSSANPSEKGPRAAPRLRHALGGKPERSPRRNLRGTASPARATRDQRLFEVAR